jgi:predicted 2-oxoglutarate/Fe(II)-dependent dioxygenase YbiX
MSSVIFSKNDCDFIKSYWDDTKSLNGSGRISFKIDEVNTISYNRKVNGYYIDYNDTILLNFILERLQKINIKSITPAYVKIAKYKKGDYFEPHHDFNFYGKGSIYKTLVVQLSDASTYIGGDLYVKGVSQPREQGSYSLFFSSDIHEVKLVENGIRFSLTIFLQETDFINTKTLI